MIAALAASPSFAETYYANVPFNFGLENKVFPAGQYVLDSSAIAGALVIRSDDRNISVEVTGPSLTSQNGEWKEKWSFIVTEIGTSWNRYGHEAALGTSCARAPKSAN